MNPVRDVQQETEPPNASCSENPGLIEATERFLAELEAGDHPSVDKYLEHYPEIAEELAVCLKNLEFLHRIAPQLSEAGGGEPAGVKQFQTCPQLGDFRILHEIGRGGMGVVYAAEQLSLARKVALKVLPFAGVLDHRQLQRFKREAQAAALLHHQNIVPVYVLGSDRGVHFYAMQYIEGQTLAEIIRELRALEGLDANDGRKDCSELAQDLNAGRFVRHKPGSSGNEPTVAHRVSPPAPSPSGETVRTPQAALATERSLRSSNYFRSIAELGIQAAEALDHAHDEGVVHRDIKPSNLILDERGKLWVTDFGLARVETNPGVTMTGDLVGTLRYMSPEQALCKRVLVDERTDIYSLCASLYELLTLQPVFAGSDRHELIKQIAFDEPRPPRQINRAIPLDLATIVLKGLERNPVHRYHSAKDLADDLRRFVEHRPIRAKPPSVLQRTVKWSSRHKPLIAVATAMLVVMTIGLAISNLFTSRALQERSKALSVARQERTRAESNLSQAQRALDELYLMLTDQWKLGFDRDAYTKQDAIQ